MTNNIVQAMQIKRTIKIIQPENKKDEKLIEVLKRDYHVRQMPFVQAYRNGLLIDCWTGFRPEKIKQYRKEA